MYSDCDSCSKGIYQLFWKFSLKFIFLLVEYALKSHANKFEIKSKHTGNNYIQYISLQSSMHNVFNVYCRILKTY